MASARSTCRRRSGACRADDEPAAPLQPDEQLVTTFVVTDIESDGHNPLESSMLSFASVAVDVTGAVLDEFEAVLDAAHRL